MRWIFLISILSSYYAHATGLGITDINQVVNSATPEQCNDISTSNAADPIDSLIAPAAIKYVDQHFTNIDVLSKDQRQSLYHLFSSFYRCIDESLASQQEANQLKFQTEKKMPILNKTGFSFVILKPGQVITDLPQYAALKGKLLREVYPNMADDAAGNRHEEDISAEGSHRMMVLSAADCKSSIHGEYHVPYHEFTHFLHLTVLAPDDIAKMHSLYENAKKKNAFLDDYAAENEFEYFAQGVEAYLSINKLDKSWRYYKSERKELLSIDPDLYRYIASLVQRCSI